jgi:hypothetical protein
MARKGKEIAIFSGLSVLMGAVGGLVGAGFAATVSAVTALRGQAGWLLFLLPGSSGKSECIQGAV